MQSQSSRSSLSRYRIIPAFVALAVACVLFVGCGARKSEQHREQGNVYLRNGNLDRAAAEYQHSLDFDADNAKAHIGLGRTFELKGDAATALEHYMAAIEVEPKLFEAYVAAGTVLLAEGRVADAEALAGEFKHEDTEQGIVFHALLMRMTQRDEEAVTLLEDFLESGTESIPAQLNLSSAYLATGRASDAEAQLHRVLDTAPHSASARILLVEAYRVQGRVTEMVAELAGLAKEQPDNQGIQIALALAHIENGDIDEAEAVANPILKKNPESGWANFAIGCCLAARGNNKDAAEYLQTALDLLPEARSVIEPILKAAKEGRALSSTRLTRRTDRIPSASAALPTDKGWQQLWREASLATLVLKKDDPDIVSNPEALKHVLLAAIFIGNLDDAARLSDALPEGDPVSRYYEAVRLLSDGPINENTVQSIRGALENWQGTNEQETLMRTNAEGFILSQLGLRAQAFTLFANSLEKWPDNGVALRNLVTLYDNANMPEFAASCLQKLVTVHGESIELRRLLARAYLKADRMEDAQTLAESSYALHPEDPVAAMTLAGIYSSAGELSAAIRVLARALEDHPDDATVRVLLARTMIRDGAVWDGLDLLAETGGKEQGAAEVRAYGEALLGNWEAALTAIKQILHPQALSLLHVAALIELDRNADAIEIANALPAASPETGVLQYALGASAIPSDSSQARLATALRDDDSATAIYSIGLAYLSAHLYTDALVAFEVLEEALKEQPALLPYLFLSLKNARFDEDRIGYGEALAARYSESAVVWLHLADLYSADGDPEKQKDALLRATSISPELDEAWARLAAYAEHENDDAIALQSYKQLLELKPDDPAIMNNLAYALLKSGGDTQRALDLAQRAQKILHSNAGVLHTVGLAQLTLGDLDASLKNLELALQLRPGDPTLLLDYGRLLLERGQQDEGKSFVALALTYSEELGIDFPRRAEAEKILAN